MRSAADFSMARPTRPSPVDAYPRVRQQRRLPSASQLQSGLPTDRVCPSNRSRIEGSARVVVCEGGEHRARQTSTLVLARALGAASLLDVKSLPARSRHERRRPVTVRPAGIVPSAVKSLRKSRDADVRGPTPCRTEHTCSADDERAAGLIAGAKKPQFSALDATASQESGPLREITSFLFFVAVIAIPFLVG